MSKTFQNASLTHVGFSKGTEIYSNGAGVTSYVNFRAGVVAVVITAKDHRGTEVSYKGKAKLAPGDVFDFRTGLLLAYSRALKNQSDALYKKIAQEL